MTTGNYSMIANGNTHDVDVSTWHELSTITTSIFGGYVYPKSRNKDIYSSLDIYTADEATDMINTTCRFKVNVDPDNNSEWESYRVDIECLEGKDNSGIKYTAVTSELAVQYDTIITFDEDMMDIIYLGYVKCRIIGVCVEPIRAYLLEIVEE
jgi:hypothetical protein